MPVPRVLPLYGLVLLGLSLGSRVGADDKAGRDLLKLPAEDDPGSLEGLFPPSDGSHVSQGFFVEGRPEDLTTEQKQALESNNRGVRLLNKGKIEEAVASFREGLRIVPGYVTCLRNLGIAYKTKGDYQRARTAFAKVLILSPNDADAHVGLGLVLYELGEKEASRTELAKAAELSPGLQGSIETFLKEKIGK